LIRQPSKSSLVSGAGFAKPQQDVDMTQFSAFLSRARLKNPRKAVIPAKAGIHFALVHP
jgi:hypothetical protein